MAEEKRYWFKAKRYGYGWYPSTWQGWGVLLIFITLLVSNFHRIDANSHSVSDTLINFIPQTFLLVSLLIYICYKTGEPARWRWGDGERN